ncbi:oligogalacturonate lyase family protein [Alkalihalobacillus trypoxylicola]|uniref:Oligogalacturonate lyase domain-containing protein n=1 Tax=Alkalihalobacillus trypoxylicola TaxID=519424 RepID=A0A162F0B3_9BACI|nr:oligogalacturonate lyase family protein [Alkalihalobacillus trypoxylicola]KYG34160.1 hypothetical protein AZF04_15140 [Alkalihalobacillus trypoxylicola]
MGKGKVFESETSVFYDSISGAKIIKLTSYYAHNFHLYFTNEGFYNDGNNLLIGSDRENKTNLFSVDLSTGQITQLTDFKVGEQVNIQNTFLNPLKNEAYFMHDRQLFSLNLDDLKEQSLFQLPEGYIFSGSSCTADGKSVLFGLREDLSSTIASDLTNGYLGFAELEAARPHSQICKLSLDTKEVTVIHEENRWIGHVNASPTKRSLLTFCHEGPWNKVDHRMWAMDMEKGEVWKLREGKSNQYAGHEYWHADGVTVGYHGFTEDVKNTEGKFLGSIKYDNTELEEYEFPYQNMHIFSNDAELIVGDGQQSSAYGNVDQDSLFLWKKKNNQLEGPRILCKHRGSFQSQKLHVHPRLTTDGTKVVFTSDMSGYGHVYIAEIPDFETLPKVNDKKF